MTRNCISGIVSTGTKSTISGRSEMSMIATSLTALFLQTGEPSENTRQPIVVPVAIVIRDNSQERFRLRPITPRAFDSQRPLRWENNGERFQISLARISLRFIF